MALNINRKGWVGVGFEATYGVPVVIADYVPFTDNTLKGMTEPIPNEAAYGIREKQYSSVGGKKWSEGDFEMNLDATNSVYFLGGAMGTINSANVSGSIYDHTLTRNNANTPKSLTIVSDRAGIDRQYYNGVGVASAELAVTDGLATLKSNLVGKFPITTTSGTLTTASGGLYSFKDAFFAFGSTVAAAAAGTNLKPSEFTLTINNDTEPVHRFGNADADTVNHKEFSVEAEGTTFFEDTTERDRYQNTTKAAACLKFTGVGIGGGLFETLTVNMYQVRVDTWELETGLADFIAQKYKMVLEYDEANDKSIDIVARNRKTSY